MYNTRSADMIERKRVANHQPRAEGLLLDVLREGADMESQRVCDLLEEVALLLLERKPESVSDICNTIYDVLYNDVRVG